MVRLYVREPSAERSETVEYILFDPNIILDSLQAELSDESEPILQIWDTTTPEPPSSSSVTSLPTTVQKLYRPTRKIDKLLNNPKEIANIDINRIIQWSNYIHKGALIQAEFAEEITQKLTDIEARGRPKSTPRTKRQLARIHDIRPSQYVSPDTFSLARDGINCADPRCNFVERSPSISFCASSSRARRRHLN